MNDTLNVHLNREHRLVICRPTGVVSEQHANELLKFLIPFEQSNSAPFNRLLDLSEVTEIQLTSPVIFAFTRARREETKRLPPFRTAIIAPDHTTEAFALIYAALMKGSQIQVAIFADARIVPNWLGVPESALQLELAHHE